MSFEEIQILGCCGFNLGHLSLYDFRRQATKTKVLGMGDLSGRVEEWHRSGGFSLTPEDNSGSPRGASFQAK